jgi:gliding motility-associated protein GldL
MPNKKNRRKATGIQGWMDSRAGQMFLNYAYSWGAAIVILGALFKLTHIHGADLMLFIGMGTEVVVFFLSGFERPWTDDGKDDDDDDYEDDEYDTDDNTEEEVENMWDNPQQDEQQEEDDDNDAQQTQKKAAALANAVASVQVPSVVGMTPQMKEATESYVEQLNQLTETLRQVSEQSARLTRDSEEMETMNRTLTGINRFYEMQLRSVGQQSTTIDDVNEQTKRLATQLEELNAVYARMVEALKMNMNMKSGE